MQNETTWRRDSSNWKARYSKLYSSRCISLPQEEEIARISFMSNTSTPYQSLLVRSHHNSRTGSSREPSADLSASIMSHRSDPYASTVGSTGNDVDNLGGHDTMLLNMVREQSKVLSEEQDHTVKMVREYESDGQSSEACVHGMSLRFTDRSISRSRFSRVSTKRDMDIPSILAYNPYTPPPVQLKMPGFEKLEAAENENIPRWSIRRSVCPVCSQKWKDKSAINNVKYSGLKRNSSSELPTVIAPARLRSAITMTYVPRPALAVVDEDVPGYRLLRNTSATWQLTRARRFRSPKPVIPPPEATAPPSSTAPLARKDLDIRVNKFLSDKK